MRQPKATLDGDHFKNVNDKKFLAAVDVRGPANLLTNQEWNKLYAMLAMVRESTMHAQDKLLHTACRRVRL